MAARDENFLDDGTVDPFTGLAPAQTPEEQEAARLARLRYYATQTANQNLGPGDYSSSMTSGVTMPGSHEDSDAYMREHHRGKYARSFLYNLERDPATMAVLAGPLAVTGVGAGVGGAAGLGFGAGEGSLVGAAAPGIAAQGAPFTMATPTAFRAGLSPSEICALRFRVFLGQYQVEPVQRISEASVKKRPLVPVSR